MTDREPGTFALALRIAAPLVIGIPLVFILWEFVNDLLSARATRQQVLIAVPTLIVFLFFLRILGNAIQRFAGTDRT